MPRGDTDIFNSVAAGIFLTVLGREERDRDRVSILVLLIYPIQDLIGEGVENYNQGLVDTDTFNSVAAGIFLTVLGREERDRDRRSIIVILIFPIQDLMDGGTGGGGLKIKCKGGHGYF